jgi:hypothetical protein
MNSIISLSVPQLHIAAKLKEKIESLESQLGKLLGSSETTSQPVFKKRKKMSASAKAKISAAAKARWAKVKGNKSAPKAKSKMSVAMKKKLSVMAKARWAKIKAAGKKKL